MPKKDKDKKQQAQSAKKAAAPVDPLPQVWLPDQVIYGGGWGWLDLQNFTVLFATQLEITGLSYGKGPRIPAGVEGDGADSQATQPTDDEQDRMARFWAMEEANSPKGWEEEEEVDYAEISKRSALQREKKDQESRNSGTQGTGGNSSFMC